MIVEPPSCVEDSVVVEHVQSLTIVKNEPTIITAEPPTPELRSTAPKWVKQPPIQREPPKPKVKQAPPKVMVQASVQTVTPELKEKVHSAV